MGITINGFETRFQKPKFGGENPFKSAKPFDDIVDYNSLEDGDLFYIEQKEGWKEVNFGENFIRTMPEDATQSLPEYINKKSLRYEITSNLNTWEDNVDDFFQFDFTPYIKIWVENPFISKPANISIGAFILPKYESPYSMEDIPRYLDKDQFKKFSEKLPTINLGTLRVLYYSDGRIQRFADVGSLYSCIIGNKILQIRNYDDFSFDLLDITEDVSDEVRSMVPIHFLAQDNSYDYFSVGNNITINGYTAWKNEDNSVDFEIYTDCDTINQGNYVTTMTSVFVNNFYNSDNGIPHISSIIDQWFYYLKNDVKYYSYIRPEKIYIIYNNGIFSSLDRQYNIISAKTYLNIMEYFENNPESNMIFPTSELMQLFSIKPILGEIKKVGLMEEYSTYNMYLTFNKALLIKFIDKDNVKIELDGGYSHSSSSQELSIGEFEE